MTRYFLPRGALLSYHFHSHIAICKSRKVKSYRSRCCRCFCIYFCFVALNWLPNPTVFTLPSDKILPVPRRFRIKPIKNTLLCMIGAKLLTIPKQYAFGGPGEIRTPLLNTIYTLLYAVLNYLSLNLFSALFIASFSLRAIIHKQDSTHSLSFIALYVIFHARSGPGPPGVSSTFITSNLRKLLALYNSTIVYVNIAILVSLTLVIFLLTFGNANG